MRPVPALQAAITWLKDATDDIRNARLEPLGEQPRAIWTRPRQESSVDLGVIRLSGTVPRCQLDLSVTVDGSLGAALHRQPHALDLGRFRCGADRLDELDRFSARPRAAAAGPA